MPKFSTDALWSQLDPDRRVAPQSQQPEPAAGHSAAANPTSPADLPPALASPAQPSTAPTEVASPAAQTSADTPSATDSDALIARLATLSPLDYARSRSEAARALGIRLKFLDPLVRSAARSQPVEEPALFPEIVPSEDAVVVSELLDDVAANMHRFVVLPAEQADAAALLVALTHCFEVVDHVPLAFMNAAEPACGKTVMAETMSRMCARPLQAANVSLSALFRSVEKWRPTLIIDEADTFLAAHPEITGLLNAGFQRGGFVLRTEAKGDDFEPRRYSVFSPKFIAGNNLERHLREATLSRGIMFTLRRKLPHEKVQRLRDADPADFERIRSQLARFAVDYAHVIERARPALPDELTDRQQDCWSGLFAIAHCAGPAWVDRAIRASLALSRAAAPSFGLGNELLQDIRAILEGTNAPRISTTALLEGLLLNDERPWATFDRSKPMTPRQLAGLLAPYGIRSKTVRLGRNDTPKGYERSDFLDAFNRYLPDAVRPPQPRHEPEPDSSDEDVY